MRENKRGFLILHWQRRGFPDSFRSHCMNSIRTSLILSAAIWGILINLNQVARAEDGDVLKLESGWQIQAAAQVAGDNS
jgi:hypothetical protein